MTFFSFRSFWDYFIWNTLKWLHIFRRWISSNVDWKTKFHKAILAWKARQYGKYFLRFTTQKQQEIKKSFLSIFLWIADLFFQFYRVREIVNKNLVLLHADNTKAMEKASIPRNLCFSSQFDSIVDYAISCRHICTSQSDPDATFIQELSKSPVARVSVGDRICRTLILIFR